MYKRQGNYLYVIEEESAGDISILGDNDISGANNWIQDFQSSEWRPAQDVVNFNDVMMMIRPLFGKPEITVSTKQAEFLPALISVSPNPFTETLQVTLPQEAERAMLVELAGLDGQKISSFMIRPGEVISKDLKALPKGMYLLHSTQDNRRQSLRILKQ